MTKEKTTGYQLFLVSRAHHNLADRVFSQNGISRGHVPILFELGRREGITQCELAEALELTQATLTNTLQRMEGSDLVYRRRDSSDGRYTRIYLTDSGRNALALANASTEVIDQKAFENFSFEEMQKLTQYLERIHTNLMHE